MRSGTKSDTRAVALITGGASGIGRALAEELARRGVESVIADRQTNLADAVVRGIRASGGTATAVELDVRDLAAWERVTQQTIARTGRIDYLFNNAGIGVGGEVDGYIAADWDDVIDVNLRGVTNGIQAVYPVMISQRSGQIVNTASMAGLVPSPGNASYVASKHAVVGLSKVLRVEARRHGVHVSVVCPGAIRTPILTGGKFGRMNVAGVSEKKMLELWSVLRPMDVDAFAKQVLDAVARDVPIIIVPAWWKAIWWLERFSPTLSMRVWAMLLEKLRSDLVAAGGQPVRATPGSREHASSLN